jgi:uncharacterized protein (TIGR00730 family)
MKTVAVFCGSSLGVRPSYVEAAKAMGREVGGRGLGVVYGGGRVGLMGVVADAAMAAGAKVQGVIPETLAATEVAHAGLTELFVVPSMHARKAKMADLADAFVAMPGGFGTLDELFEVLTWAQLGLHKKPIGVYDVDGFFAPLLTALDGMVREGFVRQEERSILVSSPDPASLLDALARSAPLSTTKWGGAI